MERGRGLKMHKKNISEALRSTTNEEPNIFYSIEDTMDAKDEVQDVNWKDDIQIYTMIKVHLGIKLLMM